MAATMPSGAQQRKEVLLHVLRNPPHGLVHWCSCTWSKPVVQVWRDVMELEMAYCLVRDLPGSRAAAAAMAQWLLNEVLPALKEDGKRLQPLADVFKRLAERMADMAGGTHTQLMKQLAQQRDAGTLPSNIAALLPDQEWAGPWRHALPVAPSGAGGSVFDQDCRRQVEDPTSRVRPNQRDVATALYTHAQAAWRGRPQQQVLDDALEGEYQAVGRLRQGLLAALQATYTLVASDLAGTWQAPLTQRLLELRSAGQRLSQVLTTHHLEPAGGSGPWNNPAQGAVEPTGGGKTGIINLAPLAALPLAPRDVPRKVLVVAPNTTIRAGIVNSYSTTPGANCLRDVLQLVSHPEMLPAAANLAAYSCLISARRPADSPVGSSTGGGHAATAAPVAKLAAVVAAAAVLPLADEDQDEDMEEYNQLLNNLVAAAAGGLLGEDADKEAAGNAKMNSLAQPVPSTPQAASPLAALAAADVVVANIQQLTWSKLEKVFPRGYFGLVVIDEAHHTGAHSYASVMEYFAGAMQLLLTATPFRGDRQALPMADLMGDEHSMKVAARIQAGLVKNVALALVPVTSVRTEVGEGGFLFEGGAVLSKGQRNGNIKLLQQPTEVAEAGMRRDVQSAAMLCQTEAGRDIQLALMRQATSMMERLRAATGHARGKAKHKIIGKAPSGGGAEALLALAARWQELINEEFGGRHVVTCTHSEMPQEQQDKAKRDLEDGVADIILQVAQLGEGYDHPSLSIAVLFCIPRSIGPYWQFVGRTTRIIKDLDPYSLGNTAFIVAHPLLGAAPLWEVYKTEEQEQGTALQGRGAANPDLQLSQVEGRGWTLPSGGTVAVRGAGAGLPATAAPQVFPGLQLDWLVEPQEWKKPAGQGGGSSSSNGGGSSSGGSGSSGRPAAGAPGAAAGSSGGQKAGAGGAGGAAPGGSAGGAQPPKSRGSIGGGAAAPPPAGGAGSFNRAHLEGMAARAATAPAAELKTMVQQLRGVGLVSQAGIPLSGAGRTGEVIRQELLTTLAALVRGRAE